jgi:hypothetical protein
LSKLQNVPALYWGKQDIDEFPVALVQMIEESVQYIDLTAGSAQVPYYIATQGVPVAVNDRNPYAHWCHRLTMQECQPPDWPHGIQPVEGWISTRSELRHFITPVTAQYLDGVCLLGIDRAVAVARMLVRHFRGEDKHSWDRRIERYSRQNLGVHIMTEMSEMQRMRDGLRLCRPQCTSYDVTVAIDELAIVPGAVCYIDPAWPWDPAQHEQSETGYEFYTNELGGIVTQEDVPPIDFWSANDPERIMQEIANWVDWAFVNAAGWFVVSSQSTNYPPFEDVMDFLSSRFNVRAHYEIESVATTDGKKYTEFYGVFEA